VGYGCPAHSGEHKEPKAEATGTTPYPLMAPAAASQSVDTFPLQRLIATRPIRQSTDSLVPA
jgi:hypothetical protein